VAEWVGFSDVWRKGLKGIYTIRLVRRSLPTGESVIRHRSHLAWWLLLSYGPSLVTLGVLTHWPSPDRVALLLVLGTVNAGTFAAAALAWTYALNRADAIDALLRPCANRDKVVGVIGRAVEHDRQAIPVIAAAALPWIINAANGGFASHQVIPHVLLLLNITWTLVLTVNDSYWLIVPPLIAVRMLQCHDIRLRWNDPARTDGMRVLSEGFAYPALFVALAALAVTVPGLTDHAIFGAYLPYLFAWLFILSLWNGAFTQACLYIIVRRFKLRILDELASDGRLMLSAAQAGDIHNILADGRNIPDRVSVYQVISTSPGLPFGTGSMVQYVAALGGSLAGFLLQSPHL
jgi:hypothetical protein